jgi:putative membrane protein
MSGQQASSPASRFEIRVTADSHFAWVRTRLALERTVLAYMRTAVSLIGFGFAIVQFFHNFRTMTGQNAPRYPGAPWYLGLALIACGVVAALVSVIQYRVAIRYLWGGDFAPIAGVTPHGMYTPVYAISIILILIGAFAFFAVLLNFV